MHVKIKLIFTLVHISNQVSLTKFSQSQHSSRKFRAIKFRFYLKLFRVPLQFNLFPIMSHCDSCSFRYNAYPKTPCKIGNNRFYRNFRSVASNPAAANSTSAFPNYCTPSIDSPLAIQPDPLRKFLACVSLDHLLISSLLH